MRKVEQDISEFREKIIKAHSEILEEYNKDELSLERRGHNHDKNRPDTNPWV